MNIDDQFRDLAPLSPRADPDRWARMTAGIQAAAAPELARRRAQAPLSVMMMLSRWGRPTLSGAAAVAAAAMITLFLSSGAIDSESLTPGVSDGLGYSQPLAAWIEADWQPSVEEILLTMETP